MTQNRNSRFSDIGMPAYTVKVATGVEGDKTLGVNAVDSDVI